MPKECTIDLTGMTLKGEFAIEGLGKIIVPDEPTPPDPTPPPDTEDPTTPLHFAAVSAGPDRINLSWDASSDNVGVVGYEIERCSGAGCTNFTPLETLTETSYEDTGLTPGTPYSYRGRAKDANDNVSAWSAIATATTQASEPPGSSLILEDMFNTKFSPSVVDPTKWQTQTTSGAGRDIVADPLGGSEKWLKTWINRTGDPAQQYRGEIVPLSPFQDQRVKFGEKTWLGFRFLYPSTNHELNWHIFQQWHQSADPEDDQNGNPPLTFQIDHGNLLITSMYNASQPTRKSEQKSNPQYNHGPMPKDQKLDFVVCVVWDWKQIADGGKGYLKVWINGAVILDKQQPMGMNDAITPYTKQGIYASKQPITPGANLIEVLMDQWRWAGKDGSYEAVCPR